MFVKTPTYSRLQCVAAAAALLAVQTPAYADETPTLPKFKAGLSMSFLASPFFVVLTDLTTKEAKRIGLNWLQPTDAQSDPGKQIADVQTLVNSGVKGLVVVPRDSDAIGPALGYAASRNVPVVALDSGVNTGKAAMTVRADNVAMGRTACEAVGQTLGGKGKVLELQGDLLNSSGRDRTDGFETCMKGTYPGITIIARPTRWEQQRAADATQTILTATPDLDAIYVQSDTIMMPGVISVLQQTGHAKNVGEKGHIFLVGIDGGAFALDKIRSGELDATVSQPLDVYASAGINYLQRAVAGEVFKEGPTSHGSAIVRSASGNLEDLLPSPLVTKANVDDPVLWGNQGSK